MASESMRRVDEHEDIVLYFAERDERGRYPLRPRSKFVDGKTVIMEGLPHPIEYVYGDVPYDIADYVNLKHHKVCVSYEGTSILIFYHNDKWFVSTHKRLDAFKSYWADTTTTFGHSFAMGLARASHRRIEDIVDPQAFVIDMCDKYLDKNKKYIFILPARFAERVGTLPVVDWPRPVLTLIMNDKFVVIEDVKTFPGVYCPEVRVSTIDDLLTMVRRCNPDESQGYYFRKHGCALQTKIYNAVYDARVKVRGNVACLKVRYMFLRRKREDLALFIETYPEFDWKEFEKTICDTCSDIVELQRGNTRVIPFQYEEFVYVLTNRCGLPCTFRNLMELTKTAPLKFNKVMNARKKAHRKQKYEEEKLIMVDLVDEEYDMFDQIEALEKME